MSYGPLTSYSMTIASFATSSSGVDMGRGWKTMYLQIPTMTSQTQLYIQGSNDNVTFARVYFPLANATAPVASLFNIPSNVTSAIIPIPNGIRYMKVESTAVVSFTASFRVICSD